jgi:hypothetical protein
VGILLCPAALGNPAEKPLRTGHFKTAAVYWHGVATPGRVKTDSNRCCESIVPKKLGQATAVDIA